MITQTAVRMWGAPWSMPSLAWLIDQLLDTIEEVRAALVPASASGRSCGEMPFETDRDPFGT